MKKDNKSELQRLRTLISEKAKKAKKKRLKRVNNNLTAKQSTG